VAATVLLLGALAASGLRMAPQLAILLVGGCGFLHGLAHGQELAGAAIGAAGLCLLAGLV